MLSPSHGSQLGGAALLVTARDTMFQVLDNISCLFAQHKVEAVYLNSSSVMCVSPELTVTGVVEFKLEVERAQLSDVWRVKSGYTSRELYQL